MSGCKGLPAWDPQGFNTVFLVYQNQRTPHEGVRNDPFRSPFFRGAFCRTLAFHFSASFCSCVKQPTRLKWECCLFSNYDYRKRTSWGFDEKLIRYFFELLNETRVNKIEVIYFVTTTLPAPIGYKLCSTWVQFLSTYSRSDLHTEDPVQEGIVSDGQLVRILISYS